jgi:UDP-glucuronate 4-epimerase
MSSSILVTGAAGFIGQAVCLRLAAQGADLLAVDNFDSYYEPELKYDRAARLAAAGVEVRDLDIATPEPLAELAARAGVRRVIHLAAQAGVRHSITAPFAYQHANLAGHLSVLECCRRLPDFEHLVYASSSSVYGDRSPAGGPFSEDDRVDRPASLYAATKRSGELMSECYAGLYGIPQTGLRFFTVYGPWGRPDMAYFSFTRRILAGEEIEIFGEGRMRRDFTFIDDVVDGVLGVLDRPPAAGVHRLLNVGNDRPEPLLAFVAILEQAIGRPARKVMRPMQSGDVAETWADIGRIAALTGYAPRTTLAEGLPRFVDWYRERYRV